MKKYSLSIKGHSTSISLEPEFWEELKRLSSEKGQSVNQFVSELDEKKPSQNLSSAIRLEVLKDLKSRQ